MMKSESLDEVRADCCDYYNYMKELIEAIVTVRYDDHRWYVSYNDIIVLHSIYWIVVAFCLLKAIVGDDSLLCDSMIE